MSEEEIVSKNEYLEMIRHDQFALLSQVSQMMQGTIELERLLHLILTCVTAGEAMGFNRAFLFLIDEKENLLQGEMGVGPSSWEEAHLIWSEMAKRKHSLEELLALYERTPEKKSRLDELCRQMRISLKESAGTVVQTVLEGRPIIVNNAKSNPQVNPEFISLLGVDSFAAVPLVARDKVIGVIVADNPFSQRPITREHLEILTPFGIQAGVAIERARIYERLVESEKAAATGRLAADIAHKLRNPLVAIGGFAHLIEKELFNAEANKERVRIIIEEVEHLEGVIREGLDFLGPVRRSLSWANTNELIEKTLVLMRESLEKKKIKVVRLFSPKIPQIEIDLHQFRDVIADLIGNAIHFMPEGGSLAIGTEEGQGCIKVIVADTGIGIPEELQERIFEPFFTTKTRGTGLGLAISKKVVEEYGGEIKVESSPGQGTTFTIILPIAQEGKG